jgi:hypothetical protein
MTDQVQQAIDYLTKTIAEGDELLERGSISDCVVIDALRELKQWRFSYKKNQTVDKAPLDKKLAELLGDDDG